MYRHSSENPRIVAEHLHELIEALERRAPHPDRKRELEIARQAAELKAQALLRLSELRAR